MSFWHGAEALSERADLLNHYQYHFGDAGAIGRDMERYHAVTPESAMEWGRRILGQKGRVVLRVVPKPKDVSEKAGSNKNGKTSS